MNWFVKGKRGVSWTNWWDCLSFAKCSTNFITSAPFSFG